MGLFWQISPTVQTVDGSVPPSYDEANAGAYYSILTNIVKYRFLVLFIHLFFPFAGCPGYYYGEGTFSWDDKFIRRIFIRKVTL